MLLQDILKTEYMVVSIDLFTKIQEFQHSDNFARDTEKNANIVQKMAKELGVHLILIAQIRRDVANRKFSRPTMQDIKNSGALGEISDIMLGIHRPYYNPEVALKAKVQQSIIRQGNLFTEPDMDDDFGNSIEKDPDENIAEIIIMKQRMGENNTLVNLFFNPDTTCFESIEEEYQRVINARKKDLATE
jgi:replicative DNA helicase